MKAGAWARTAGGRPHHRLEQGDAVNQLATELADQLFETRCPLSKLPEQQGPGVYAFFLNDPVQLTPIESDPSHALYVGMTDQCLSARNHYAHPDSGFSTFRRSLGAILKDRLRLTLTCRSKGSEANFYRFTNEGENRLTQWMETHLYGSQVALSDDILAHEKTLIRELRPPLNLTGWPNPQRRMIKLLWAACATEAEQTRDRT